MDTFSLIFTYMYKTFNECETKKTTHRTIRPETS
jgi:hypothetical protein